jgi:beta-1,4-mannosyl-glycoprotein beta-1,4-N-acetylglucosaminyltransferase
MRIFDTFLFDGELGLLQHRLEETYELVDYFVLVEATRTYRNQPKPLVFAEHRRQFAWAATKIRSVALDGLGGPGLTPREHAAIQRNAILLGLRDAVADDIVLILDADEIPSRELLQQLRSQGLEAPSRLAMTRHYEFLNVLAPASPCCPRAGAAFPMELGLLRPGDWNCLDKRWYGHSGVAVHFRDLSGDQRQGIAGAAAYSLRFGSSITAVIAKAGRHLTGVDCAARLERKLGRVFHEEYADDRGMSILHLLRCRRHGLHHRGWWYAEIPQGELPDDLERLAARQPHMVRTDAVPHMILRRTARTWAWLRVRGSLPDAVVLSIDRHFSVLWPVLAVPLLLADVLRALTVQVLRIVGRSLGNSFADDHRE